MYRQQLDRDKFSACHFVFCEFNSTFFVFVDLYFSSSLRSKFSFHTYFFRFNLVFLCGCFVSSFSCHHIFVIIDKAHRFSKWINILSNIENVMRLRLVLM